jgi:hypothetical protein
MSQILIINNVLDANESEIIQSDNVLKTFCEIKSKHPKAKIYLGNTPSPETDISPNLEDRATIARLLEINDDCTIVCHSGDVVSAVTWAFSSLFGAVVQAFVNVPSTNQSGSKASGSSNNDLSNPENKQRINERIPYILGRVKAIPDLYAPPYRHFIDGVEVEELLLSLCENPVQVSNFKEGDTPVQEITGKSVTAYGLNQNITGTSNIYKVGDTFSNAPVIAKQSNSINGQTLIPPNATRVERSDIYFVYPNQIKTLNAQTQFDGFSSGESIVIEGANFGISDLAVTGTVNINYLTQTLSITSSQTVVGYADYRKINITAMLITDPENGSLDLAGLYDISSITYSGGVYTIALLNAVDTNANFANMTANASTSLAANLTANTANIFLDGTYSITSVDSSNKLITLTSPSSINSDWNKLLDLAGEQTPVGTIKLRGSQENYIGWFTVSSQQATGLLFNFKALNGIYQGSTAKTANITVEYQKVINGVPTGTVYSQSVSMTGRPNNRDSVGASLWIDLPFSGAVRFRARRTNDNGEAADLVDEVKFYQAYAFHYLSKLTYDDVVIVRARTIATVNATSQESRQLNCIAESLVYDYSSGVRSLNRIPSRNIADLTIDLALNPRIGRRLESEIDFSKIYETVAEIEQYFGSEKMAEFNYTLDNINTSFEEMMRMIASATCSHDRRFSREIFYELESSENLPVILFNHRNKVPQSEKRQYEFKSKYDGVELTYVDSESGWIEKIIRAPSELITNPRKIDGTGIVYKEQAHIIAWREWNKILFTRETVTFSAYCESDLVFRGDCILNTDDTRLNKMCSSGEVRSWSGLNIKCSQPFHIDELNNYVIHLQMKNGSIDVIEITQGSDDYSFFLARPPIEQLVTQGQVKTAYIITTEAEQNERRYLISSKTPTSIFENEIIATNYDDRFYQNDKDIINNLI